MFKSVVPKKWTQGMNSLFLTNTHADQVEAVFLKIRLGSDYKHLSMCRSRNQGGGGWAVKGLLFLLLKNSNSLYSHSIVFKKKGLGSPPPRAIKIIPQPFDKTSRSAHAIFGNPKIGMKKK